MFFQFNIVYCFLDWVSKVEKLLANVKKIEKKSRRSYIRLIEEILIEALDGATKTRIVYNANLNFKVLHKYMRLLLSSGLIVEVNNSNGKKVYKTTEKGRAFLEHLASLNKLLENFENTYSRDSSYPYPVFLLHRGKSTLKSQLSVR